MAAVQDYITKGQAKTLLQNLKGELETKALSSDLEQHVQATNPHGITKDTIELGNVDNTSDLDKPISTATQAALTEIALSVSELSASVLNKIGGIEEKIPAGASSQNLLVASNELNNYYNRNEINDKFNRYYNKNDIDTMLDGYYSDSYIDTNYYTKDEVDISLNAISEGVDLTLENYYDKNSIDQKLNDYYTQNEIDSKLDNEYYDKSYTDVILNTKVDKNGSDRLMTEAEGNKLNIIESGAQVNNLETISLNNGQPIYPDEYKNINLTVMTNAVNDLLNYYTKNEVDGFISAITTLDIRIVNELPTSNISTTTIYLIPAEDPEDQNIKDEYINTTGTSAGWEKIGSTAIDLSDYYTSDEVDALIGQIDLSVFYNKDEINNFLSEKADLTILAPAFNTTVAYKIGDYVTYDGKVYRFKSAHSAAAWNSSHVDEVYAVGQYVIAGKKNGTDLGTKATAEGYNNIASGSYSHAEGCGTTTFDGDLYTGIASGEASHSEGISAAATGVAAHAEGFATTSSGKWSHSEGDWTIASGDYSHAEGSETEASNSYTHSEGYSTKASGSASHAEGANTTASGEISHTEGTRTIASGNFSHAEGSQTSASGIYSHAEGSQTTASGYCSHAEGRGVISSANYSHASGNFTIAQRRSQTVIGELNIADTGGSSISTRGTYAFIIGNGTSENARSNALTVDWDGNVRVGAQSQLLATQDYVDSAVSGDYTRADTNEHITADWTFGGDVNFEGNLYGARFYNGISVDGGASFEDGGVDMSYFSADSGSIGDLMVMNLDVNNDITIDGGSLNVSNLNVDHDTTIDGSLSVYEIDDIRYINALDGDLLSIGGEVTMDDLSVGDFHIQNIYSGYDSDPIEFRDEVKFLNDVNIPGNSSLYVNEIEVSTEDADIHIGSNINMTDHDISNADIITANTYQTSNSDYAEKFEEFESCPQNRFVTLKGNKIKLAQSSDDYILGVTSDSPSIIGDKDNNGIPVGLLGKLWVEQDGSAEIDKYVTVKENGIATKSNSGYRVMEIKGNKAKILFR